MLDESEQLLCFAAVVKTGAITRGAELLNCSKAHVSRKVAALEKRLRTRLLHRTTRHIELTDAGQTLALETARLLESVQNLRSLSRNLNKEISGRFVITAPVSFSTFVLAPELSALQQAFPAVQFELQTTNTVLDLVESQVDLAIRTGDVVNPNMVARQIGKMREIFLASEQFYPVPEEITFDAIQRQKLLVSPAYLREGKLKFCCGAQTSEMDARDATLIRDNPITVEMLFQQDYVAWLPDYCRYVNRHQGRLVQLLPEFCGIEWPVYLVFPFQVPLPPKLQQITEFLQQRLSQRLLQ
ncbi:LysR family transcriptional regulator [Planctobacterium marinum]|uniref:LysR family transcriptional regulator n=1 Tax=Planctobacterium marinum TaxID=1631968 RepID=A0AA48HRZ2_9ALTE|nr:LysR family transcriptional regulator [Planctobacterium marinum]